MQRRAVLHFCRRYHYGVLWHSIPLILALMGIPTSACFFGYSLTVKKARRHHNVETRCYRKCSEQTFAWYALVHRSSDISDLMLSSVGGRGGKRLLKCQMLRKHGVDLFIAFLVDGSIHHAAGPALLEECDYIPSWQNLLL
jgi:hypothetical protein